MADQAPGRGERFLPDRTLVILLLARKGSRHGRAYDVAQDAHGERRVTPGPGWNPFRPPFLSMSRLPYIGQGPH